jgi:hypothetical protein
MEYIFPIALAMAAVFVTLAVIKLLRTARQMRQRPSEFRKAAAHLKFEPRELTDDTDEEERLIKPLVEGTLLWAREPTHRQDVEHVMIGKREGFDILIFDASWKTRASAPTYQTVVAFRVRGRPWPSCFVVPMGEHVEPPGLRGVPALRKLEFADDDLLAENYVVFAADEGRVRGLLGEEVSAFLLDRADRNPFIESLEDRILYYQRDRWVPGPVLPAFLAEGLKLAHWFAGDRCSS